MPHPQTSAQQVGLRLRLAAIAAFLILPVAAGGQSERITYPWIYSAEAWSLQTTASHKWLNDGTALVWEESAAGIRDGIRRLDPATGRLTPFLGFRDAVLAIAKEDRKAARGAVFPDAIDPTGRRLLYVLAGDLFLVEAEGPRALRITQTPVEEKSARFSPDGERLAFIRENDLWIYEIATGVERRITQDGSKTLLNGTLSWVYWEEIFGRQDLGYWWSDSSRSIAFLQTDESPVGIVNFLDHRTLYPTLLTQRYPKAGTDNPVVRVGIAHPQTDGTRIVWADFGDHTYEYIARVKWLPGGSKIAVSTLNRQQTRLDLFWVDAASGKAEHILTEENDGWVNIHDDLRFLPDGKGFLWASERTGYNHIYLYDMSGKLIRPVTSGDWSIRDSGAVFWLRQAIKAVDAKGEWVYFNALKKSSIEHQLYRAKLDGTAIEEISKEPGSHSISFRKAGDFYLDEFSNARTPPGLSLHRSDGKKLAEIASPRTQLAKSLDLVYPEFFEIPARDGFKMPAYIYKPKDFDPKKKYPLILYGYGGPSAPSVSNSWQGTDLLSDQILLRNGFLVACVDNRSATAKAKKFENTIVGQMYGDSELNDLVDGVRWLKEQPFVDAERVGIWGWSGGGTLTLLGMTNSQEFKAGIAVAAVTRWEYYDTIWGEAAVKRPQDNPEGYARTDLTAHAKNLHGRLLLVHGTYDDNVHIQNAWSFVDALIQANKRFELMIYPMRKHSIADRPARIHLFETMLDFWKRHL